MKEAFGLIVEWKNEAPLLMEQVAGFCDYETVMQRANDLAADSRVIRWCVVELTPRAGNVAAFRDFVEIKDV